MFLFVINHFRISFLHLCIVFVIVFLDCLQSLHKGNFSSSHQVFKQSFFGSVLFWLRIAVSSALKSSILHAGSLLPSYSSSFPLSSSHGLPIFADGGIFISELKDSSVILLSPWSLSFVWSRNLKIGVTLGVDVMFLRCCNYWCYPQPLNYHRGCDRGSNSYNLKLLKSQLIFIYTGGQLSQPVGSPCEDSFQFPLLREDVFSLVFFK